MRLLQVLEKQLYASLIVGSSRSLSLQRFTRLALEWQLPDAHVRQALNYFGLWEAEGHLLPVMAGGATPVVMAAATTPLTAANLNKYVNAEGSVNVKIRYAMVQWSAGTTFVVNGGIASAGIVNGDLVWNTPIANALNVGFSGYTLAPFFSVSPFQALGYRVAGAPTGATAANVTFFNFSGVQQTVLNANFSVAILIMGP